MKDCLKNQENLSRCNCTYAGCPRKGICCECLAYHRGKTQVPACFFPPEIEKTYDRSLKNFLKFINDK